jgi:hypothetical protein
VAKLARFPDTATIIANRQRIDFYFWKGIPVARSWPRFTPYPFSAAQVRSQQNFAAAAAITSAMDPFLVEYYKAHAVGQSVTWIDAQRATTLGHPWVLLREPYPA